MRQLGVTVPLPPSPDASRADAMQALWTAAGLVAVETRAIDVQRTFVDFDDYWTTIQGGPSVAGQLKALSTDGIVQLQTRLRERLPADSAGRITCSARANAVRGRVA